MTRHNMMILRMTRQLQNINTAVHVLPTTVPQHLQLDGFIFYDKECITIAMYPLVSTTL